MRCRCADLLFLAEMLDNNLSPEEVEAALLATRLRLNASRAANARRRRGSGREDSSDADGAAAAAAASVADEDDAEDVVIVGEDDDDDDNDNDNDNDNDADGARNENERDGEQAGVGAETADALGEMAERGTDGTGTAADTGVPRRSHRRRQSRVGSAVSSAGVSASTALSSSRSRRFTDLLMIMRFSVELVRLELFADPAAPPAGTARAPSVAPRAAAATFDGHNPKHLIATSDVGRVEARLQMRPQQEVRVDASVGSLKLTSNNDASSRFSTLISSAASGDADGGGGGDRKRGVGSLSDLRFSDASNFVSVSYTYAYPSGSVLSGRGGRLRRATSRTSIDDSFGINPAAGEVGGRARMSRSASVSLSGDAWRRFTGIDSIDEGGGSLGGGGGRRRLGRSNSHASARDLRSSYVAEGPPSGTPASSRHTLNLVVGKLRVVAYAEIINSLIMFFAPLYSSQAVQTHMHSSASFQLNDLSMATVLGLGNLRLSHELAGVDVFLVENVLHMYSRALNVCLQSSGYLRTAAGTVKARLSLDDVVVRSCIVGGAAGVARPRAATVVVAPWSCIASFTGTMDGKMDAQVSVTDVNATLLYADIYLMMSIAVKLDAQVKRLRSFALKYGIVAEKRNDVFAHGVVPLTESALAELGIKRAAAAGASSAADASSSSKTGRMRRASQSLSMIRNKSLLSLVVGRDSHVSDVTMESCIVDIKCISVTLMAGGSDAGAANAAGAGVGVGSSAVGMDNQHRQHQQRYPVQVARLGISSAITGWSTELRMSAEISLES